MKPQTKYKITIEDESHLTEVTSRRFTLVGLCAAMGVVLLLSLILAGLIISSTPLRTLLPGYLKESERSATEEGLMRLDSLMEVYEKNQAYIDNILRVTDTERTSSDSTGISRPQRRAVTDTLTGPSRSEQRFVSQMEERERFNISVLAPIAAEGISFRQPGRNSLFTTESRGSEIGEVLMLSDENVENIAEGTVIAIYYSAADRGYEIVVQHSRGFITGYSHMGSPMVSVGDHISAGQVIAMSPHPDTKGRRILRIRMWHNGLPVIPYDYIGEIEERIDKEAESYESPRGK